MEFQKMFTGMKEKENRQTSKHKAEQTENKN